MSTEYGIGFLICMFIFSHLCLFKEFKPDSGPEWIAFFMGVMIASMIWPLTLVSIVLVIYIKLLNYIVKNIKKNIKEDGDERK